MNTCLISNKFLNNIWTGDILKSITPQKLDVIISEKKISTFKISTLSDYTPINQAVLEKISEIGNNLNAHTNPDIASDFRSLQSKILTCFIDNIITQSIRPQSANRIYREAAKIVSGEDFKYIELSKEALSIAKEVLEYKEIQP